MKKLMIVSIGRSPMYFDVSTKQQLRKACLKILKSKVSSLDFHVPALQPYERDYYGKSLREIKAMPRGQEKKECLEYYNKHRSKIRSHKERVKLMEDAKKAARYNNMREAERIVLKVYEYKIAFEPVEEV